MELTVYGPLRAATGQRTVRLDADPETVGDALEAFLKAYPRAESRVLDGDGNVRSSVRVMLDGERVEVDADCPPGATLALFPAMRGG